ncbi:MAG: SIR2 family protein, partial [Candidatus Kariarchaeaceae archaeon]
MNQQYSSEEYVLPIDAFVRAIGINKRSPHSFFLGSGASISSGVLSAEMCVWQWKKTIFLTNNPDLDEQLFDISLPSIRNRIQNWIENNTFYPKMGSPNEYSFFADVAFPISGDRRRYFQNLSTGKIPHVGYQYLALLAQEGLFNSVWTTNFDGLVAKAVGKTKIDPIEIGLDTSYRVFRQPNKGEVLCVSLHGDYRYDELKNTSEELQEQNNNLLEGFITTSKDTSLIITGYSGRDASVMDALTRGFTQKGTGRLYWCGYEADEPNSQVKNLIEEIRATGREAFYISTQGFDDVLERLAFHVLGDENIETAKIIRESAIDKLNKISPAFVIDNTRVNTIIKSNAFELDCPSELIQFEASGFQEKGAWQKLRDITHNKQVVAGLMKGKILALGTIDQIKDVFGDRIKGELSRVPITEKEMSFDDGVINSLLTSALVNSISLTLDLDSDSRRQVWKKKSTSKQIIEGKE